jgi:16S rRNA (adenine1518-N6/adenine1519-N6)-dimethyltransferase
VRLIPHKTLPIEAKDPNLLADVVRTAFGQRRKTLRNNMKGLITGDQLEALGIDPGLRPERLSLAQFIAISDAIHSLRNE